MAKTSYIQMLPGEEELYFKHLQMGDRFAYGKVIKKILEAKGNCFIYSSIVRGSGGILFSLLLQLFGFSKANGKETEKEPRYALLTTLATSNTIRRINSRFNKSHQVSNIWRRHPILIKTISSTIISTI